MKKVINVVLVVCAVVLGYICMNSITRDQDLDKDIEARKKVVIARLIDIKTAEEAFKSTHDTLLGYEDEESGEYKEVTMGRYAESFDELIYWLKTARYPEQIIKEGLIQEAAQRQGWTEKKVASHIFDLKKQGLSKEQIQERLIADQLPGVWIDTVWAENPIKALYGREDYPVDSLRYVPFSELDGNPNEFELMSNVHFKMKIPMMCVMECSAPFATFMKEMGPLGKNKQINMKRYEEERNAYPGLKIGDLANWNNNAGNWE